MPITQNRMMALIDAAKDYQQAWRKAVQFFAGQTSAVQAGLATHEQAWNQLTIIMQSHIALESPITTTETLARESEHFRTAYKKNIQSADWQRAKRGANPTAQAYGLDETQQAKQKSRLAPAPTPAPITKAETAGVMTSKSTDSEQVNAESDLFAEAGFAPGLDDKAAADIDQFIADRLAVEEYEAKYGAKPAQAKKPTESK